MQHLDEGELTALLDGQTAGRSDGQQHLGGCAECKARLEEMRVTRDRARDILRSGAPSGARLSFQEILARRGASQPAIVPHRPMRYMRTLAWAASIVLALSVGWYARELELKPSARAETGTQLAADRGIAVDGPANVAAQPRSGVLQAAPPVMRAQEERQEPRRDAGAVVATGVATGEPDKAKASVAENKDEPVKLAADDARLKKELDTMALHLDAVVVAESQLAAPKAIASAEGASAQTGRAVTRRARADMTPAAMPPAPVAAPRPSTNAYSMADDWARVDLSQATRLLGRAPLVVPGLEILEYQVIPQQPAVRVMQRMQTGTLEMIEQKADAGVEIGPSVSRAVSGPGVGGLVEGIQLRLWGPVTYDSLRALIGKLR